MMLRSESLRRYASVFVPLTGLRLAEFEAVADELIPQQRAAHPHRLATRQKPRRRAVGGGTQVRLCRRDPLLLTVLWLRRDPTHEMLGYGFGVDATTVGRVIARVLSLLEQSGRATTKMPDPGRKRRLSLDDLLERAPELAVSVDSFEQRVQKPRRNLGLSSGSGSGEKRAKDTHYSGKTGRFGRGKSASLWRPRLATPERQRVKYRLYSPELTLEKTTSRTPLREVQPTAVPAPSKAPAAPNVQTPT